MNSPPALLPFVMRRGLFLVLFLLTVAVLPVKEARSQATCNEEVTVRLFPFYNTTLQRTIEQNASIILTAINKQSYQRTSNISTDAAQKVVEEIMGSYCTRRSNYSSLLVPQLTEDAKYEIRGIHLISSDDGLASRPQAVLTFDADGLIIDVDVIDNAQRQRDRERAREAASNLPRGEEVLDLILSIEEAYNQDNTDLIVRDVRDRFSNASVIVSRLSAQGQASNKSLTGNRYATNLGRAIGQRELEVTYENIEIFQHIDENGESNDDLYRVTVLQHWLYPEKGYQDSDYISFDVQFLPEHSFYTRRAGRGGITLKTSPPGAKIARVNNRASSIRAPYYFENIPQQYHYLVVDDVWFETAIAVAEPDQVAERDTIELFLKHKPAQLQIITLPTDSRIAINGMDPAGFESGEVITVPAETLIAAMEAMGMEPVDGEAKVPGSIRQVEVLITHPYYEDLEETITLQTPELVELEFEMTRLQGELQVASNPEGSEVLVNTEPAGLTPLTTNLEVTGDDRPPYTVVVKNDTCFSSNEGRDCTHYIPSAPQEVVIKQDDPQALDIDLMPFYVRNLTRYGDIDVGLDRSADTLLVQYLLSDTRGKDAKYTIQMSLMDAQGMETGIPEDALQCTGGERSDCVGRRIRSGANGFAWPMDVPAGSMPVLTLSEKRTCWACVLLPAAAGVATAYIFSREGSGGGESFTPPPRPGDF